MLFIVYDLIYNKNEGIKEGDYIDLSEKQLDSNNNYIFEEDSIPIGFYIKDIDLIIDKDLFKLISSIKEYSTNRGHISGQISLERLEDKQRERIEQGIITEFNKNKTRTKRNDAYKYEFCNMVYSFIFNDRNKRSIKYKKEIEQSIKPIAKYINKQLKSILYIKKDNNNYLETIFTDIIINKGLRSAIHRDANNDLSLSCLMQFSENDKLISSNLNLPDYNGGISIPLFSNKSLLCLPLTRIRHGNDPIKEELLNSRISMVFYNRDKKYKNESKK
jgi:flagellar biosynthesis regulator FlaF